MSDKTNTVFDLHTGGALGTDEFFADSCSEIGFNVKIHSFEGHTVKGKGEIIIHTMEELREADEHLSKAAQFLKRPFPSKNKFTNNLLRRNYLIIKNVESVYAIGKIESEYVVEGGTGWVCQMCRQLEKSLMLFNLYDKKWYSTGQASCYWPLDCDTPNLIGNFAGIGTRGLNKDGKRAIKSLLKI